MKMFSFKGGIFPPEKKELCNEKPITEASPSTKTVCIPITMGGAPNDVLVKVGDSVAKGQVIAKSDKPFSAPVHSSVAGVVKKIEPRMSTANVDVPCIIIEADGSDRVSYMQPLDPFTCTKEEAVQRVRDAGIVGMGGASFPTAIKLNPPKDKPIDYVFANAAECEPYLTIDERVLQENTQTFIDGMAIILKITGGYGYIALESNKAYIKGTLEAEIQKQGLTDKMEVAMLKTKYPQGCEKSITDAIVGREIPAGGIPADVGCLISNVGTMCAISAAFREGKPLIERSLTISGGAVVEPKNLRVPVGTIVGDLIPEVIQLTGNTAKILSGGPMMGFAMTNAQFPILKGTSGVLFLTKDEVTMEEEDQCINCGRCVGACPEHLSPCLIIRAVKQGNLDKAKHFGLLSCIECGSCAFVCPASVKLVQRIRLGKFRLRQTAPNARPPVVRDISVNPLKKEGGAK